MAEGKDIVEFVADNGDVIEFEVVDYFLFDTYSLSINE